MEWAKNEKKTGLLLLIDFKKAYDSISFKFIVNTLLYFGFGNNYIKWINILLNNFKACINHAGNILLYIYYILLYITTLLLSKLSHLAFVLPGINKKKLKEIETEIYSFIWGGQEKVARGDAKQPESREGLGFPDIFFSWTAFKFSWFRRLVHSHAAWKDIFSLNIEENFNLNLDEFCSNVGTVYYDKMSKKLSNPLWSECLRSIKPLMLEHLKNAPENLTSYPIWGSNVFIMNSSICSKRNFGNVGRLIRFPADILIETVNGTRFMLEDEFSNKFNEPPNLLSFISIKQVIRSALLRLGVTVESLPLIYPILPPMLNLISYSSKGCNKWSKLLKSLE